MGIDTLEMPEIEEEESRPNGLYCFIDGERPCGPDCMSWTTEPFEAASLSIQQRSCVLLVAAERLGRYSGGLLKVVKNSIDDAARNKNTPQAADPLGRKAT